MTVSGSNTADATIINLMPSTMYIVQVAAINDAGYGVYSDPLTAITNDSTEHLVLGLEQTVKQSPERLQLVRFKYTTQKILTVVYKIAIIV